MSNSITEPIATTESTATNLNSTNETNEENSTIKKTSPLNLTPTNSSSTTNSNTLTPTTPKSGASPSKKASKRIVITTHPGQFSAKPEPLAWDQVFEPLKRGAVVGTLTDPKIKNAIGTHMGAYTVYRALAIAQSRMESEHRPDFTNTAPSIKIGPFPSWSKIVSLDPWGAEVCNVFKPQFDKGVDIRPTIAITKAHINIPELKEQIKEGKLQVDGKIIVNASGDILVTKAAIDPVWYLPGVCQRLGIDEVFLRRTLFEQTGGMFPELVTRFDLKVFLPPIGGVTVYIFGDLDALTNPDKLLAVRVHDECNGSDVFGSDICTCRPYLVHGCEVCIQTAQEGGAGCIIYLRKEGRALGEVVKYLVYNARKRQEGGDSAAKYFERTRCVAGVEDARLQSLMPDVLHWLGITRIDRFVSMSNDKFSAVSEAGIEVRQRLAIPDEMIPADAHVEINAKIAKGYFTPGAVPDSKDLQNCVGRTYD
eukprot:TRINITY_DN3382_c0_g3_i1.p1 TRINITY_DN3382_c0_g3~~TRINITY_DN3382_c0_g3_i1.p1  ORF type:complete len:480 (-),score=260.21 TRINITY_DN3382_c0_g3_i1:145-1584(-)